MKRLMVGLGAMALATGLALAAPAERWLHVRVQDGGGGKDGETVHVNIPLSLAEKVLPAVQADRLKDGKIKIEDCDMKGVDGVVETGGGVAGADGAFRSWRNKSKP